MNVIDVVKAYVSAVERFDVDAVAGMIAEDMTFTELPNAIRPTGGTDDRAAVIAGLQRAGERKVISAQRYHLDRFLVDGETVVVEGRWEGTMAMPLGRLAVGDTMTAHLCMLIEVRDGRIARQRNYDCYEPFAAK